MSYYIVGYKTHGDERFRHWGAPRYRTIAEARRHVVNWVKLHPGLEVEFRFDAVTRYPQQQVRFVPWLGVGPFYYGSRERELPVDIVKWV